MGLNIKNERVHELAREAARLTGGNQTSAIELALERFLADLDRAHVGSAHLDLVRTMQRAAVDLDLATDELYDDNGLPR